MCIYIYAWWYDWWSLCTYYNFIDMIDDACVLLHLMKNDVRTVCIGYYKTIQHCKTISKSVEILQCSISYYYILYKNMLHGSMTQKLRKKHGEKKKNVYRVTVSHILSHLFLFWNVHTCFVALFRYIHLRSFPTVSLWGIHQLWTVPFMETAPRVVNG